MIEVAVAIGVIAILAGAVAPLALKALNQQREQKTRDSLRTAWEAIFGARDRRTMNMLADFNFDPLTMNLATMTTRPGAIRAYAAYPAPNTELSGGWNGPYWTGSASSTGLPQDGWGRALVLRRVSGNWQLLSWGPNGTLNTAAASGTPQGDDLAYPVPPQALPTASLTVNVFRMGGFPATGATVAFAVPGTAATPDTGGIVLANGVGSRTLHPGRAIITATIPAQSAYPPASPVLPAIATTQTLSQAVDLLPGGSAVITFTCQ